MLLAGMPGDARTRTTPAERAQPWTTHDELLAQLIEIVSIGVADRVLRKPVQVPRPRKPAAERRRAGEPNPALTVLRNTARLAGRAS